MQIPVILALACFKPTAGTIDRRHLNTASAGFPRKTRGREGDPTQSAKSGTACSHGLCGGIATRFTVLLGVIQSFNGISKESSAGATLVFSTAFSMAANKSAVRIGLETYPFIPVAMQCS
jgi:hypothetical protein